jgi:hypothetical protein
MALGRGDISHDLAQYIVEAATGYQDGFWGLLGRGATFRSTGRKRTKPGRALIVEHRADLNKAEQVAGMYIAAWRAGERNPVADALTEGARQFQSLGRGEALCYEWPSTRGVVEPLPEQARTGRY